MLSNTLLEAIGQTLIDSVFQGMLILLIAMIGLALMKKRSSRLRHNFILVCVILMPILSVNSFLHHNQRVNRVSLATIVDSTTPVANETIDLGQGSFQLSTDLYTVRQTFIPESYTVWISIIWLAGAFIYAFRVLGGFYFLNRLNNKSQLIDLESVKDQLAGIKSALGIRREIILKVSERVTSPMIYGFLKPVIIFPMGLIQGLTTDEVEAILLHELSHLKRNDFIINIFINALKAIYFYHPAFWWLSSQLDNEREFATDEMVMTVMPNTLTLIKALSKTQEYQLNYPAVAFAGSSKNQLLKRVNRIMKKQQKPNWSGGLFAMLVLASAFLITSQQTTKADISEDKAHNVERTTKDVSSIIEDSTLYLKGKVSDDQFQQNTVSIEKALKEILDDPSPIELKFDDSIMPSSISRNGKVLKGEELKVYLEAYAMIHSYDGPDNAIYDKQKALDELNQKHDRALAELEANLQKLQQSESKKQEYFETLRRFEARQAEFLRKEEELKQRKIDVEEEMSSLKSKEAKSKYEQTRDELVEEERRLAESLRDLERNYIKVSDNDPDNDPLFWIVTESQKDTLQVERVVDLNPRDIRSLTVYKDESARALSPKKEAKNGIVLINVPKDVYLTMKKSAKKVKNKR